MMHTMAFVTMLLAGTAVMAQDVADLIGTWDLELPAMGGRPGGGGGGRGAGGGPGGEPPPSQLVLRSDDGALSGSWQDRRGTTELTDVAFADGKLTFTRSMQTPRGEFSLNYEVWIVDGRLAGLMKTPRGEREFSGTRAES